MTKGVRIRASPAMNSSQIGIVPRGATVSYIEEVENVDGVWLRLTDEACAMYCDIQSPSQVRILVDCYYQSDSRLDEFCIGDFL